MKSSRIALGGAAVAASLVGAGGARADLHYTEVVRVGRAVTYRETMLRPDRRCIRTYAKASAETKKSAVQPGESLEITRLDQKVIWTVDPATRTYRAIDFPQVRQLVGVATGAVAPRKAQPLREMYEAGEPEIRLEAPVAAQPIAGLATRRVDGTMRVYLQNVKAGTRARVYFDMQTWLAADPRVAAEAGRFEQACSAQIGSAESLAKIRTSAGPWMDALVPHLRVLEKRVRATGGFPLKSVMTVTWEALASDEKERARRTPVGTFISQVTSLSLDPCEDARFELPGGYQAAVPAAPAAGAPSASAPAAALQNEPAKVTPARAPRQPSRLGGPPGTRSRRVTAPVTVPEDASGNWARKKSKGKK